MSILDKNQLFVKEKSFKIFNNYEIFDQNNKKLGHVQESKQWLRKLTGRFELDFYDDGRVIAKVKKPFSIIKPKAYVYDENEQLLGYFVKKVIALRPRFYVYNAQDQEIGMLEGDFIGWSFALHDKEGRAVVDVSKKFSGILREAFTTADAYKIYFNANKNIDKRVALAVPFMVDLILKEQNRHSGSRHGHFQD